MLISTFFSDVQYSIIVIYMPVKPLKNFYLQCNENEDMIKLSDLI